MSTPKLVKLALSDYDRSIIGSQQREVAWQGTEAHVLARYELGRVLELEALGKKIANKNILALDRTDTFKVSLKPELLELLIAVVAGGGAAMKGETGPMLGELVAKLRRAAPAAESEP